MELTIGRRAAFEIQEAFAHYEVEHAGLGAEFFRCVEAAGAQIQRNPLAQPLYYRNVHRLYLRRFPFSVFYIVGDQAIAVVAVFHSRRDPRDLFARLEEEGAS